MRGRGLLDSAIFFHQQRSRMILSVAAEAPAPGQKNFQKGFAYRPGSVVYSADNFFENGWGCPLAITDNL